MTYIPSSTVHIDTLSRARRSDVYEYASMEEGIKDGNDDNIHMLFYNNISKPQAMFY